MRRIIEILADSRGGHRNQTFNGDTIPDGYAAIPDGLETPNFPFGDLTAEDVDGVLIVTSWSPREIPPDPDPEPEPPATDLEGRVTALEQTAASWDEMAQAYQRGVSKA